MYWFLKNKTAAFIAWFMFWLATGVFIFFAVGWILLYVIVKLLDWGMK